MAHWKPGLLGLVTVFVMVAFAMGELTVLTPDQSGFRQYKKGDYNEAAQHFSNPMWKATALFRAGEFEKAAGIFAGMDTAEAAFNQGTALMFLGKYEDAILRFDRALVLQSDFEAAEINRTIAVARAERLKQKGGEGTGGQLGADEIVFTEGESSPSAGEEQVEGVEEISDEELRTLWLRQVQTKPADFLRAKFAYQNAVRSSEGE